MGCCSSSGATSDANTTRKSRPGENKALKQPLISETKNKVAYEEKQPELLNPNPPKPSESDSAEEVSIIKPKQKQQFEKPKSNNNLLSPESSNLLQISSTPPTSSDPKKINNKHERGQTISNFVNPDNTLRDLKPLDPSEMSQEIGHSNHNLLFSNF